MNYCQYRNLKEVFDIVYMGFGGTKAKATDLILARVGMCIQLSTISYGLQNVIRNIKNLKIYTCKSISFYH